MTVVCLPGGASLPSSIFPTGDQNIPQNISGARLLHTRLSSWLPSEKLVNLIQGGVDVAKVVHSELSENLKRYVKQTERM